MKKYAFIVATLFVSFIVSCGNNSTKNDSGATGVDKGTVQVLYFHGKQRCVTCRAIESLTEEVLDTKFSREQKSGKVVFKVIDISQKENEDIAARYEVAWSSLILDKGGNVVNLTNMGFSYAKSNPAAFKSKLEEELTKLLK